MKLYKYTSFEIGKSVIETSKIALSKPEWFNDPFDASPVINQNELQKAIDILNGYLLDMNVFRMLRVLKRQLTQQKQHALVSSVLMEYRTAQKQAETRPGLYTPIFTFDRLEILFNSFEKIGRLTAEQVQAKENMLLLRRRMEKNEWETLTEIISARNNMYVCCLSEVCDSILMWAYYGQDHRGVCIEVEVDENRNDFAKVTLPYGFLFQQGKVSQHDHTQDDAVDTEGGEGVLSDVLHEALDHQHGNHKGYHTSHHQHADLGTGDGHAGQQEFKHLDGGSSQHGGDGHKETELGTGRPANANQNGT